MTGSIASQPLPVIENKTKAILQQLYDATAALDEAVAVIQDVQAEEDDAFNNLSEGLQCAKTGESMQEAMETLDGFVDKIESIKDEIEKFAENKK